MRNKRFIAVVVSCVFDIMKEICSWRVDYWPFRSTANNFL